MATSPRDNTAKAPSEILIIGAGVFGLSTTLSLLRRPQYSSSHITIIDASPTLPNPSGSSVDTSRIVRADYAHKHYAEIAVDAQRQWRDTSDSGWGGQGRYHETGLVLTADEKQGWYVKEALENVKSLAASGVQGIEAEKIEVVYGQDEIKRVTGFEGVSGKWGYVNWNSGWADAEACVKFAIEKVKKEGGDRVTLRPGCVVDRLILNEDKCQGVELNNGEVIKADLVVLAAGAWSPSLIDLEGRCLATGQVLTYIDITEEEQKSFEVRPTVFNLSVGTFIIPPRDKVLKIARHGFGYRNMKKIRIQDSINPTQNSSEEQEHCEVSVPQVGVKAPLEGQIACREAMRELIPSMIDRPFINTRICWYCDTPDGDFLITYHPTYPSSLLLATGGSGHGFKFFPNIGDKIADAIEHKLDPILAHHWRWREEPYPNFTGCDDGSRAGPKGMYLDEEMKREKL